MVKRGGEFLKRAKAVFIGQDSFHQQTINQSKHRRGAMAEIISYSL
jgi:hypothetical protein